MVGTEQPRGYNGNRWVLVDCSYSIVISVVKICFSALTLYLQMYLCSDSKQNVKGTSLAARSQGESLVMVVSVVISISEHIFGGRLSMVHVCIHLQWFGPCFFSIKSINS